MVTVVVAYIGCWWLAGVIVSKMFFCPSLEFWIPVVVKPRYGQ